MPRHEGCWLGCRASTRARWRPPPTAEATALAAYRIRHARLEDVRAVASICVEVFIQEQMFKERLAEEQPLWIQNIIAAYTDMIRAKTASNIEAALEKKREVSRP
jgi:hypothetical protein